jgi:ribulose-phosphate 3-epimerase
VAGLAQQVREAEAMLEVHLMIERPERQVSEFVKAGADSVTFHAEATPNVAYAASLVRESGACVGVAINPATPVGALAEVGHTLDIALCMTVNPGWGGQPFIEHSLDKVARSRAILGGELALEVDGGIDPDTASRCRQAGASVFVAGSAIFDSQDPGAAYLAIARSVEAD